MIFENCSTTIEFFFKFFVTKQFAPITHFSEIFIPWDIVDPAPKKEFLPTIDDPATVQFPEI